MSKIELLAPAGDLERLRWAFLYDADAVYIGGKDYSLRANAKNFSLEEIKEGVQIAHSLNKKVYVTVNIVFHNEDLNGLVTYLKKLEAFKVDAIIVSDLAVINLVKKHKINLDIHLSTQMSTLNKYSAQRYLDMNVKRLVLAREASKEDIVAIKKYTNAEAEVFIHGAMCCSFSGRCVLSNCFTNRDANRGGCAQVCRWAFNIEGSDENFCITPKDLNMAKYIQDLIDINVNSLKIEGRMRSIYYVSTLINTYRNIIDKIYNKELTPAYIRYYTDILNRCANRESTAQFYDKLPTNEEQYFWQRDEASNQDFIGVVLGYDSSRQLALIEQRNYFKIGDTLEAFGPDLEAISIYVEQIFDENDNEIQVANHPQMLVKVPVSHELKKYDILRKKVFDICSYL